MNAMQTLIRVPEVAATMRELSKEMMKVCILESWKYIIFLWTCYIIFM